MDYLVDKALVFLLCLGLMVVVDTTTLVLVGMLVAISFSALFELPQLPMWVKRALPILYCLLVLAVPSFMIFLPLIAGDLFRLQPRWLCGTWLVPMLVLLIVPEHHSFQGVVVIATTCLCVLSSLLMWRAKRQSKQHEVARIKRDDLAQVSRSLERRNRDLLERQELELKLATLDERSRIAREIHDNVGHLLTRSILQVKALSVVYGNNKQLAHDLEQVGDTLDTAFKTVRTSVHNLYENAAGLDVQLKALAHACENVAVTVEYHGTAIPPKVASTFMAISREALSNTQRHSDATSAQISVVEFPGLYQLIVHDNGSADPGLHRVTQTTGMGLASMEERARTQGGIMRVSYDKGFKVLVTIPRTQGAE